MSTSQAELVEQKIEGRCIRGGIKGIEWLFHSAKSTPSEGFVPCNVEGFISHLGGNQDTIYLEPTNSLSHLVARNGKFAIVQWPNGKLLVQIDYGNGANLEVSVLPPMCDFTVAPLLRAVLVKQINNRQKNKVKGYRFARDDE